MKKLLSLLALLLAFPLVNAAPAAPEENPALPCQLAVTPEVKKAFQGGDAIEVKEITGTSTHFQVGGTYRVTGVCRQHTLKSALLYLGNTSEPGPAAIVPVAGSSLTSALPDGSTAFDCTFRLLRPGILHLTIYDPDQHGPDGNAYAGVYLGDVVCAH